MMAPSFMDIARARKREAEAQILEILKRLEQDTELNVHDVHLTIMPVLRHFSVDQVLTNVTIDMEL